MRTRRISSLVSLALAIALLLAISPVRAATITLERSQEWYGQGDTKVHGVCAANVDGDADIEIVTVGEVYTGMVTGTRAQLKIWSWNSNTQVLTLEATKEWSFGGTVTVALSVYAGDIDNDNHNEIVTAGYGLYQGHLHNDLTIWKYNPLLSDYEMLWEVGQDIDTAFNSVYATQIDTNDSYYEIVVAGVDFGTPDDATLSMFTWNGTAITVKASTSWRPGNGDANATGVYAKDVDGDSTVEILTSGYYYSSGSQWAEVRVWYNGTSGLTLEDDQPWRERSGDTEARAVFAENIDTDSDIEILTCGMAIDGRTSELWADLQSFIHSGTTVSGEREAQWQEQGDDTVCSSVFVKEVTGGSPIDIITGGKATISGTENGQVVVWEYSGNTFSEQDSAEWYTTDDAEVHSVFAENIDADAAVEMLSGGEAYDGTRIRAQLRIWYWT